MATIKNNGVVVSEDATSPFSLQNLTPNTAYTVEVEENGATGSVQFTTTDIVPGAPTVTVTAKAGAIDFTIVDGTNDGTAITGYTIYYTDGTTPKTQNTTAKTGTITGLTDGTQYSIQATAKNGKGESSKSAIVNATPKTAVTGVTVTPTTATVDVGKTTTITATVAPANATNKAVTWASGTPANATVNASTGVVTGVKAGTSVITATTTDGNKTATSTVTVTNPVVAVTGVTLDATTATLDIAGTKQLTATVAPTTATNKAVNWSTSAAAIATVSSTGLVTAVAEGEATITVKTTDGNKTATCVVTVNPAG